MDFGEEKQLEGDENKEQRPQESDQTESLKKDVRKMGPDEPRQVGRFLGFRELIIERGIVGVIGEQAEGQEDGAGDEDNSQNFPLQTGQP